MDGLRGQGTAGLPRNRARSCLRAHPNGPGDQPGPGVLQALREYLEHPPGELVPEVRVVTFRDVNIERLPEQDL